MATREHIRDVILDTEICQRFIICQIVNCPRDPHILCRHVISGSQILLQVTCDHQIEFSSDKENARKREIYKKLDFYEVE
jgi:hypothetical protein